MRMNLRRKESTGVVLFAVIGCITLLGLLAGALAVYATSDIRAAAQFKRTIEALYQADAGVQHVRAMVRADLAAGTFALDTPSQAVQYTAPAGFTFDPVTELARTAVTNTYRFRVTGRSGGAADTIEVTFRRASFFDMGLFGDLGMDLKAFSNIYTYDSTETQNPTADDSLGGGWLGSNGSFGTKQDTFIDGSFTLGESAVGADATWNEIPVGSCQISGEAAIVGERIDPDPLGVINGELADTFAYYSVPGQNDNLSAKPPILPPHFDVSVNNGGEMILTSGNYYISDVDIKNGGTLTVNASAGPVNIYLAGGFEAKEGSTINMTGNPTDLRIYSNSDEPIILKNSGSFKGLIYAPLASIAILNSGDFYGVLWGQNVEIKNSGDVYIDMALMRAYLSNDTLLLSWKEIRE